MIHKQTFSMNLNLMYVPITKSNQFTCSYSVKSHFIDPFIKPQFILRGDLGAPKVLLWSKVRGPVHPGVQAL